MTLVAAVSMVLISLFTPVQCAPVLELPSIDLGNGFLGLWVVGTGKTGRSTTIIIFVTSNFGKYYTAVTPTHILKVKVNLESLFDLICCLTTTAIMCCCTSAFRIVLGWKYFSGVSENT